MNFIRHLARLKGTALNILFPPRCIGCGREGSYICQLCRGQLSDIRPPFCLQCGKPFAGGTLCPGCSGSKAEVNGIRSPFRYEGVLRAAILQFKYGQLRAAAPLLAGLLTEYLLTNSIPGEVLVPVPLHQRRMRMRGYNQSVLLAREMGRLIGLPVNETCLMRVHDADSQTRAKNAAERRRNVASAFTCVNNGLRGWRVILLDDVATSGATLNACAAALKEAGATSVWGLTVAREI